MTTERRARADRAAAASTPVGRRIVLGLLGLGALGIATGAAVQNALDGAIGAVANRDPTGLPGSSPAAAGSATTRSPARVPSMSTADYTLTVERPRRRRDRAHLRRPAGDPQVGLTRDFQCVTGWRVSGVAVEGRPAARRPRRGGGRRHGDRRPLLSFDGTYTESLTLDQARRDDVIVATEMLGAPVTSAHGGPVRLFVAPMYGYKSLKWLGGIELTSEVEPGYWEGLGYDVDAWVGGSNGRDDAPTS